MITPAKHSPTISTAFAVTDIENRNSGALLSVVWYNGREMLRFRYWGPWLAHVLESDETTVYAHNGGGWDWLSFLRWLIDKGVTDGGDGWWYCPELHLYVYPIPDRQDKIIALRLRTEEGRIIVLADSLRMILCSLADAAEKLAPEVPKLSLPEGPAKRRGWNEDRQNIHEWYHDNDRAVFWEYAERDCMALYRVMVAFAAVVHTIAPIPRLGLTLSSTALKCWRTTLTGIIGVPDNPDLKEWLRQGYVGGRVEVFKHGEHKQIRVYDFNSMYPACMRDMDLPNSGAATFTYRRDFDAPGVFRVRFRERTTGKPPLLMLRGRGVREGEGVYFTPELRRFRGTLEVLGGWSFRSTGPIFRDFVDTLWKFRRENKGTPLDYVAKIIGNSTYGKLAQREVRSRLAICTPKDLHDHAAMLRNPVVLDEETGITKIEEGCEVAHQHVGIAGLITSEARARLWEGMGPDTVYCDTDSIHTTAKMSVDPGRLGALKLEFEGSGVYCGKKLYALRKKGVTKVRAKGVRVGGNLGCSLSYSDMLRISGGASLERTYRSAPTANAVFRGEKPCHLQVKRKRTLRRT